MRISDWSSDVCSSDLLSSRAQRYPALKGVNLASVIADPNARTARDDKGHLYDYNTTLYIDPDSAKAMMREQEAVTRSEEHTSELQSLMRISYAVFCLKNKNQVNNTQQILTDKYIHDRYNTDMKQYYNDSSQQNI